MTEFLTRKVASTVLALSLFIVAPRAISNPTQVFVYVQHNTPHARSWFPVRFDGVVVAKIKQGKFFVIDASPGQHMVSGAEGVPVFVDARAGKKVFVHLVWLNGNLPGPLLPAWQVASEGEARSDLLLLGYIDADKAISKSVPKKDPRKAPPLRHRSQSN